MTLLRCQSRAPYPPHIVNVAQSPPRDQQDSRSRGKPPEPIWVAYGCHLTDPMPIAAIRSWHRATSWLGMTRADPAKWMRRIFTKHGVPYVHACRKMRATEAQYQMLLEKITCSPCAHAGRTAFTTSAERSRLVTSGSKSKSSVQERVTQMLRGT